MKERMVGGARGGVLRHLWAAIDLRLSDVLQPDFWAGVCGGIAFLMLGYLAPVRLLALTDATTGLVGIVLGAVVSSAALLVAFYDQAFLRKLKLIGRDPIRYLSPFLFTIVTGTIALAGLLVLATLTAGDPRLLLSLAGGVVGFFSVWTLASLLPLMATLVQFIQLKVDALDVPDDVEIPRSRRTGTG